MFFLALAADYDGTIAHHGAVDEKAREKFETIEADGAAADPCHRPGIGGFKACIPRGTLFDRVVAENGAVITIRAPETRPCLHPRRRQVSSKS